MCLFVVLTLSPLLLRLEPYLFPFWLSCHALYCISKAENMIPICQQMPQTLLQHSNSNEAVVGSRSARGATTQHRSASKGSKMFSTSNQQHDRSRVQICRNQFGLLLRIDNNISSSSIARTLEELEATVTKELRSTAAYRNNIQPFPNWSKRLIPNSYSHQLTRLLLPSSIEIQLLWCFH